METDVLFPGLSAPTAVMPDFIKVDFAENLATPSKKKETNLQVACKQSHHCVYLGLESDLLDLKDMMIMILVMT